MMEVKKHSMKRRCLWHDYNRKGTYMLTLVVEGRRPLLGVLKDVALPEDAKVEPTLLGVAILKEEAQKISHYYPSVEVWKICLMPDHLHMIVRVKEDMPKGTHLGQVVRGFKTGCTRAWWRLTDGEGETSPTVTAGQGQPASQGATRAATARQGQPASRGATIAATAGQGQPASQGATRAATAGQGQPLVSSAFPELPSPPLSPSLPSDPQHPHPAASRPLLFEPGYNDKILLHEGQLDNWKNYLDDNPRRLLLKRRNPHLFVVKHGMQVAGRECQVVGNRFLLDIPDKMAVIVHRRYTETELAQLREQWLDCGERGGVLVSAAISPKERDILREAMDYGYRIILLRENGFPELYKPTGEAFDSCLDGLLLQISPWSYHMEQTTIKRQQCLELNEMAEQIAEPQTSKL